MSGYYYYYQLKETLCLYKHLKGTRGEERETTKIDNCCSIQKLINPRDDSHRMCMHANYYFVLN